MKYSQLSTSVSRMAVIYKPSMSLDVCNGNDSGLNTPRRLSLNCGTGNTIVETFKAQESIELGYNFDEVN